MTPGHGKDATWLALERQAVEARAKARDDAIRIQADPIMRTIAQPGRDDDDDGDWWGYAQESA